MASGGMTPIQVYLRIRPNNHQEGIDRCLEVSKDSRAVMFYPPQSAPGFSSSVRNLARGGVGSGPSDGHNSTTPHHTFNYDHVFSSGCDQYTVFQHVALPLLEDFFNGYNSTVFTYGQSSSGKTFTLMGPGNLSPELITNTSSHGIIPRFIQGIFEHIDNADESIEFTIKASVIEIYNEKIRDLLSGQDGLKLRNNNEHVWIDELTQVYVTSIDELFATIEIGQNNRTTASTGLNEQSSRSHTIIRIVLGQHNTETGEKKGSVLNLVDLAGSERVSKTHVEGVNLREAQHINKSLSALGNVVNACANNLPHIPFRDSIITHLLKDSIGGSSKTKIIITCSPAPQHYEESLSTCRFGSRAATIKNKPILNRERSINEYKTLLLNTFRIIIKRTKLLKTSFDAINHCVTEHQQSHGPSSDLIYTAHSYLEPLSRQNYEYLESQRQHHKHNALPLLDDNNNPILQRLIPQDHNLFIPTSIKDVIEELCDGQKDSDLIDFLQHNTLHFPNEPDLIGGGGGGGVDLLYGGTLGHHNDNNDDDFFEQALLLRSSDAGGLDHQSNVVGNGGGGVNTLLTSNGGGVGGNNNNNNNNPFLTTNDDINEEMKFELEQMENKIVMYQDRINKMGEQIKELETTHNLRIFELNGDIEGKEQDLIRLRAEITDAYLQQQTLNNLITNLENEKVILCQEKENLNMTIHSLNQQLEKFTTLLRQKDLTIKTLCDESSNQQEQQLKAQHDLVIKIEKLNFKLKEKELYYENIETNYNKNNATIITHENTIKELRGELIKLTNTLNQKDIAIEKLNNNIISLNEQNNIAQQHIKNKEDEIVLLKQHLVELKATINSLTQTLTQKSDEYVTLSDQYQSLQKQFDGYKVTKDLNQDERLLLIDLQTKNNELQKSLTQVKNEQSVTKQQVLDIGEQYRSANAEVHTLQQTVKTLNNRLHDNDCIIKSRSEIIQKLQDEINNNYKKNIEILQTQNNTLQDNIKTNKVEYNNVIKKYQELNDEYKNKVTYIDILKQENQNLQNKIIQIQKDFSSQNEQLTQTTANIENDNIKLTEEIIQLKTTMLKNESTMNKLRDEVNSLTNQNKELLLIINNLKDDEKTLQIAYNKLQQDHIANENSLIKCHNDLEQLKNKYNKLKEQSEERFLNFENEKLHLNYINQQLTTEHTTLQHEMNDLTHKYTQNQTTTNQLQEKCDKLSIELESISTKYKNLENEYNTKIIQYNTLNDKYNNINDTLLTRMEQLNLENIQYKNDIQRYIQNQDDLNSTHQQELNNKSVLINELEKKLLHYEQQIIEKDRRYELCQLKLQGMELNYDTQCNALQLEKNTLQQQIQDLQQKQEHLVNTHNDKCNILEQQLTNLKTEYTQLEKVNNAWREQHDALLNEKCNHYNIKINSLTNEVLEKQNEIDLLKEQNIKQQANHNELLCQQNKQHSLELLDLREKYHNEILTLKNENNIILQSNTELNLQCIQLQDLHTLQQQEVANNENLLKKSQEKINSLQIQWEYNILQQIQYEETVQYRLQVLEKQLLAHNIQPISAEECQEMLEESKQAGGDVNTNNGGVRKGSNNNTNNTTNGKEEKKSFFSFGSSDNNNSSNGLLSSVVNSSSSSKKEKENISFLKQEIKSLQQELDTIRNINEKKEKQYTRLNNNFLDKCQEYHELKQQYEELQILLNKQKQETLDITTKLCNEPDLLLTLKQQNETLQIQINKLRDANKQLLLNEYNHRKKRIGGHQQSQQQQQNNSNNDNNNLHLKPTNDNNITSNEQQQHNNNNILLTTEDDQFDQLETQIDEDWAGIDDSYYQNITTSRRMNTIGGADVSLPLPPPPPPTTTTTATVNNNQDTDNNNNNNFHTTILNHRANNNIEQHGGMKQFF